MKENLWKNISQVDLVPIAKQEGQHPLTGQRAPPISVGAELIGDLGL